MALIRDPSGRYETDSPATPCGSHHNMRSLPFFTTCVGWHRGEDINDMRDHPKERSITLKTFRTYVNSDDFKALQRELGYAVGNGGRDGLYLKNDRHVSYHRSVFLGKPCVYMVWSCIEHIFLRGAWFDGYEET